MAPTMLRANWEKAHSSAQGEPPQARCGHVAAAVYNDQVWNEEFVIVHGEWGKSGASWVGYVEAGRGVRARRLRGQR